MIYKFKNFLIELLEDFLAYWLPWFLVGGFLKFRIDVFTKEQIELLLVILCILGTWNYWHGRERDERLNALEIEVAVLKGELPF